MRDFAIALARQAGQVLLRYFHQPLETQHKSSEIDLLTQADLASERLIVQAIRQQYPQHRILAEEGSAQKQPADYLWLVDPLDGTTNYAHGYPVFSVNLALQHAGHTVLAVTYDPLRDELFCAEPGQGTTLNDRPIHVSRTDRLICSLLATGFPYDRATRPDNNLPHFGRVTPRVQGVRRGGSAALDLAYVAAGRLDGYWEFHLNPWDWAAGDLLVREAGGTVTDVHGQPWAVGQGSIVATNGLIHRQLLATLAEEGR